MEYPYLKNMTTTKQQLCKQIEKMVGYIPPGLNDILAILKHPDVIELTKEYINESTC